MRYSEYDYGWVYRSMVTGCEVVLEDYCPYEDIVTVSPVGQPLNLQDCYGDEFASMFVPVA